MTTALPVIITHLEDHLTYLTDRWGQPIGDEEIECEQLAALGLTSEDVGEISDRHTHVFGTEDSFLVHCRDPEIFPYVLEDPFAIFLEFEICDSFLPNVTMRGAEGAEDLSAWRKTLTFFSPAIHHAAAGARKRLGDRADETACVFDLSAIYGGSFGFLIPLALSEAHGDLHGLLFENGLPFPPSAHAQVIASQRLTWTVPGEDVPDAALPAAAA